MNQDQPDNSEQMMEFANFLRIEQERSVDVTLDDRRAVALDFYQGQPFGDEVEGRSQAVTRDVSEVVDFMTVGILDTLIASGKIVEFETEPEEDQEAAQAFIQQQMRQQPAQGPDGAPQQPQAPQKPPMIDYGEQATAAVQYLFMRKQNGYLILHTCAKAGLLEKFGVVKTYVEHQPSVHEERDALAGEIEVGDDGPHIGGSPVVEANATDEGWQPGMEAQNWRVKLAHPQPPKFCDTPVPMEYFRVSPDAVTLDDAIYVGERVPKTMSDLVELGYDRAELDQVWSAAPPNTIVEQARDAERGQTRQSVGQRTGANRQLWLDEEYVLYDLDGDGIAERLFVHRIGNTILKVMSIAEQPYSGWSPFPMQHRLIGQSMADKTMDIQRIRSVLLRQGLDSLYLSNSPRTLVDEGSITVDTIDDLLTVRPGGLIRYRGTEPKPLEQRDTSETSFQGMEMMSSERESRTGVTRQSQGLNPDTMNKTASGLAMNMASSQQIELYVTRNFVELLVAPMFAKRYRLMRAYGRPFRMKIEGKYVTVDPSKWPAEIDMSINVGLGTGNKDQRLQYRMTLLDVQKQFALSGSRIVGEEQLYQNAKRLVSDSGLGVASDYFLDPSTLPPAPPPQDPKMAEVAAKQATDQATIDSHHQQAMNKLQIQQEAQQAENAIKADASNQDLQTKRDAADQAAQLAGAKALKEAQLADSKQNFEMDMAERQFLFDQEMAKKKHDHMVAQAKVAADRPGGSLAQ